MRPEHAIASAGDADRPQPVRARTLPYALATLASGAALLLTLAIPDVQQSPIFMPSLAAVALISFRYGSRPGWFTLLLTLAGSLYFIIPPVPTFPVPETRNLVRLLLFCATSAAIVLFADRIRSATARRNAQLFLVQESARQQLEEAKEELEQRAVERTAELQAAHQALIERTRHLDAFFRHSMTPLVLLDRDFNFIRVNEAYAKACQKAVEDFPGHNHFEFYPSDARAIFEDVVRTRRPAQVMARPFVFADHPEWGITYWDWTLTPLLDERGEVAVLVFALEDVTVRRRTELELERHRAHLEEVVGERTRELESANAQLQAEAAAREQAQEQLQKLNRTLRALNNSNQALLHATDEAALLQRVCKIITEDCGHAMVWIGFAEDDELKSVRPVAHAGLEEGYLEGLRITWADSERGRGPTGTAIRTGRPCTCRNMLADLKFAPWREQALKRGYASSLAVPLLTAGRAFGAITVYARQPDAFSAEEVNLLAELAGDLAYGIGALRMHAARERAEEQTSRRNLTLQGISAIFEEALHCETEEELGQTCLRVAEEITGSKLGFIGELGSDGLLHDVAISDPGWELCAMTDRRGHRQPARSFKCHGLFGQVVKDGKSLLTNSPAAHPASIGTPLGHPPLTAFLGVPLTDSGHTTGLVAVANREGGYRAEEQDLLEALAPAIVEAFHRIRAEQALRNREADLRRAQAVASLGSWRLDVRRNELLWSSETYRMFGIPEGTPLTYERFLAAVHPDDRQLVDRHWRAALGGAPYEIEHRIMVGGEMKWVREKAELEFDADGVLRGGFGTVQDITETKQAEEALIRSEKLASLGRMAATIAHEINNPLETVMNAVYLAYADASLSPSARAKLDLAQKELQRVAHITRQTLGFYREAGRPVRFRLDETVDGVLDLYGHKLRNKNITVQRKYAADTRIEALEGEIRQLISNLITNSIDALPPNGTLQVRISRNAGPSSRVRMAIADNGAGIAPEHVKKIFEPFFTTKQAVGTGLGLWITKELVKKNGGSIRVRSRMGQGTIFIVQFPAAARDANAFKASA